MAEMMKALVKAKAEKGLWLENVPIPEMGAGDVKIKIEKTGICGTDMHIYGWDNWAQATVPVPMIVGHEFSGKIVAVGAMVGKYKIGDRVSGEGHIVCGACRNCRAGNEQLCRETKGVGVNRPGAFAEYLVIPEHNVFPLPDDVSDDIAAVFDPFGNAVHTALKFDLVGEDVLVTGAGVIGIMGAMVAKKAGARKVVITDINQSRLERALSVGVDYAVNSSKENLTDVMKRIGMKEGFDVGLEMSGAGQALRDMIDAMNTGGKIAILGLPAKPFEVNWGTVVLKMLTLQGIYGREMFETWYKMVNFVQNGLDISPLITHSYAARDFQQGFDIMESGESGKVVLDWNQV